MVSSWPEFASQCKSRLSAIARSCFLGRARWQEKFQEVNQLLEELREESARSEAKRRELEQENLDLRERVSEFEIKLAQPQPVTLPLGEVPPGQQFGAQCHRSSQRNPRSPRAGMSQVPKSN